MLEFFAGLGVGFVVGATLTAFAGLYAVRAAFRHGVEMTQAIVPSEPQPQSPINGANRTRTMWGD